MIHGQEAAEAALFVFHLKVVAALREYSVQVGICFSGIQAGVFRRGTEALDHLHPGSLGAENIVLGTGLFLIVVAIAVGAVNEPLALFFKTGALGVERLRNVMIVFR